MLPVKFNKSMMAGKEADGETYMLMTYVRIPPKLGAGYRSDAEPQNVEQLLVRFLMRADQVLARIGQMFRVRNLVLTTTTYYYLLLLGTDYYHYYRAGPGRGALLEDDRRRAQPRRGH